MYEGNLQPLCYQIVTSTVGPARPGPGKIRPRPGPRPAKLIFTGPGPARAFKFQARTRPGPQNIIQARPGPAHGLRASPARGPRPGPCRTLICTHSLTEIRGSPFFDNTAIQPRSVWSTGLFCGGSIIVEQSTGHHKRSRHTNNI